MRGQSGSTGPITVICVLLLALLVPSTGLADGCSAETEVELEHTTDNGEFTVYQFSVEISSQANCAKILYDLVIEEQLPNGQAKRIRKPNVITLHDGSLAATIRHEMPTSHTLLSYEAKVVSCEPCEDV